MEYVIFKLINCILCCPLTPSGFFFFRIMIQAVYSSVKNKLIFTFCGWYFKNIIIFKSQNGLMVGPLQACAPENRLSHEGMSDRFGSSQGANYSWENWGCLGITLHCVQVQIASYIPGNTAKFVFCLFSASKEIFIVYYSFHHTNHQNKNSVPVLSQ